MYEIRERAKLNEKLEQKEEKKDMCADALNAQCLAIEFNRPMRTIFKHKEMLWFSQRVGIILYRWLV